MKTNEQTAFIGPKSLKPCPLCGGPASVFEYTAGVFWTTPTVEATRIGCDRCGLEIRGDGAAEAWNTRAERTCYARPHCSTRFDTLGTVIGFDCSECAYALTQDPDRPILWRYCPNCGAKVVE